MTKSGVSEASATATLISFADSFTRSAQFGKLYREGMDLVDRTAEYLDGEGRREARTLVPPASQAYSSESIRLTTRLTQIASWLLVKRALAAGEITQMEARTHRHQVALIPQTSAVPAGFDELPASFQSLIAHSHRLYDRILRLDRVLNDGCATQAPLKIAASG
jgi:regulator of CtrA degradation